MIPEFTVTKVHGQPTNLNMDQLEEELIAVASSIPTSLGGGNNGHAGILLSPVDYVILAPGPGIRHAKQSRSLPGWNNYRQSRLGLA